MTEEPEAIAKRDWRLQAITTLASDFVSPSTGQRHPAGSPVVLSAFAKKDGALLQFPLPSVVAMYLSMSHRALSEGGTSLEAALAPPHHNVADGTMAIPESRETLFLSGMENLAAGVIFAYSAIEAFANHSIPDDYTYQRDRGDRRFREVYNKDQIERWLSLDTKLDQVLPEILSVTSPKGTKVWQEFTWLQEIRDRLVHTKSADWRKSGPEQAQGILWTQLLDHNVNSAISAASRTIMHYHKGPPERWMRKAPFPTTT